MNLIYYTKSNILLAKRCLTLLKCFNSTAVYMSFDLILPDELTVHEHTCLCIYSTCLSLTLSHSSYFPVSFCSDPSARWSALTIYLDMHGMQSHQWMCYCMNDFVSRVRTEHFPPLLHQPVLCPTMEEHLSVSSDLPQSPRFCYSIRSFIFCQIPYF